MPPKRQAPTETLPWDQPPAPEGYGVGQNAAGHTTYPPMEPAQTTAVQTAPAHPLATLKSKLDDKNFMAQLGAALPKHITPERFARVAYTSIRTTPALQECHMDSILMCLVESAQLGLEPNGVTGLAYLVPFDNRKTHRKEAQLMLGYKGKIELARRSGKLLSIWAEVVHKKDDFEVVYGLHPDIKHKKYEGEDPGPLTHVYAVAILAGTDIPQFAVLNRAEVMKRKAASRAASSDYSPWAKWEEGMWIKSAIHALAKFLPMSVEYREAFERDELRELGLMKGNDVIDVESEPSTGGAAPTSLDDFIPKAPESDPDDYGREGRDE